MTDIKALRETKRRYHELVEQGWRYGGSHRERQDMDALQNQLIDALPALLDRLEAAEAKLAKVLEPEDSDDDG